MHKSSSEFWQVIQSAVNNGSAGLPRDLGSFHPRQRWQDQGNKKNTGTGHGMGESKQRVDMC